MLLLHIVNNNTIDGLKTIFEGIGFSSSCVSKALSVCEQKSERDSVPVQNEFLFEKQRHNQEFHKLEETFPKNCAEIQEMGDNETGVRKIYLDKYFMKKTIKVFCDQETDGGGWTVLQQRKDIPNRENFYRKWTEYKLGFGNLSGEFWLGLDNIHSLKRDTLMILRVDLEDCEVGVRWAKYEYFYISDENGKNKLDNGNFSWNAGDRLKPQTGMKLSTKGAWRYNGCHSSNLNGLPHKGNHSSYADGINWGPFRGNYYALKYSKLSIRQGLIRY
ncbi:Techylectin-5B [Armadillidium vulgare]|nr:Techylectin-5B [Armadillidium vulgare]